jgi:hypothetical protein
VVYSAIEFDTVEKWLKEHARITSPGQAEESWVTEAVIDLVEQKFASQSRVLARRIGELRALIRPPRPD